MTIWDLGYNWVFRIYSIEEIEKNHSWSEIPFQYKYWCTYWRRPPNLGLFCRIVFKKLSKITHAWLDHMIGSSIMTMSGTWSNIIAENFNPVPLVECEESIKKLKKRYAHWSMKHGSAILKICIFVIISQFFIFEVNFINLANIRKK